MADGSLGNCPTNPTRHGALGKGHGVWGMKHVHAEWGMGHVARGMGHGAKRIRHGAWAMEHGAWNTGHGACGMGLSTTKILTTVIVNQTLN